MRLTPFPSEQQRCAADLLLVFGWQEQQQTHLACSPTLTNQLQPLLSSGDFQAKAGEMLPLHTVFAPLVLREQRLVLLGIESSAQHRPEIFQRQGEWLIEWLVGKKVAQINVLFNGFPHDQRAALARAFCKGALLAAAKHPCSLQEINLVGLETIELNHLPTICSNIDFARQLIDGNADALDPVGLATAAQQLATEHPALQATILSAQEVQQQGMGLLHAVGRGSTTGSRLIILEYGNPRNEPPLALIGKGITFDSGGLNLKGSGHIETMKHDMGGAAVVLAVMRAAAQLQLKRPLVAVIAAAENAIGPNSYKPGDVYSALSGQRVEVMNTDAEGRLALADALSYVQIHYRPWQLLDVATLTGGVITALGSAVSGFFCNDDRLAQQLEAAAAQAQEAIWRLPLVASYRSLLQSATADLRNTSRKKGASSITAALFLAEFVANDLPWAHFDIAGTVAGPEYPYLATGSVVHLLIEHLLRH